MARTIASVLIAVCCSVSAAWANVPVIDVTRAKQEELGLDFISVEFREGGASYRTNVALTAGALCDVRICVRNKPGYQFLGGDLRVWDKDDKFLLAMPIPIAGGTNTDSREYCFTMREDLLRRAKVSLQFRVPFKGPKVPSYIDRVVYRLDIASYLMA